MRHERIIVWTVLQALLLVGLASRAAQAQGQDTLGTIKTLYASAAYEDALTAIERARAATPPADMKGLDEYRAFCLLALGRDIEAARAIEDVVTNDPFVRPGDGDVSPRVQALFTGIRRRLLPAIVQQKYAMAKATYDRKEFAAAAEQFGRVMMLIDDPDMDKNAPGLADLRTLTSGFLDLAKTAAAPPPAPVAPAPVPAPAPAAPVKAIYDASDTNVVPPATIRQDLPSFPSLPSVVNAPLRPGVIEIVIDENGRVAQATMRVAINPAYDPQLLTSAANWRYKPATRDGVPVKYRKIIQVTVDPRRK